MDAQYFEEAYGKRRGFRRCDTCKRYPGVLNCTPHWLWGWPFGTAYCEECDPNRGRRSIQDQIQFNNKLAR